jgi:hypothetical protein
VERATPTRTVLFLVVSAVLVAAAVALRNPPASNDSTGMVRVAPATGNAVVAPATGNAVVAPATGNAVPPTGDTVAPATGNVVGSAGDVIAQLNRRKAEVRVAARRFLTAFLRYEVGDLSPPVRHALRTNATRGFADRLLSYPPRRPAAGRFPPRATLQRLDIAFVSPLATRAVVSGTAGRGGLSEEFSFVLAYRGTTWLASGPGE